LPIKAEIIRGNRG